MNRTYSHPKLAIGDIQVWLNYQRVTTGKRVDEVRVHPEIWEDIRTYAGWYSPHPVDFNEPDVVMYNGTKFIRDSAGMTSF
jgi:hypothetical protein